MIPPLDLRAATDEIRDELNEVFARFLDSGRYVLGPETTAFEQEYAAYCEVDFCVGVSSGLDALHLALRAAEIGPGDEVIAASNTYIATWLAVTHAGATVVPVEPDPASFNISPALIAEKITPRTRAILATNLYGLPVDYKRIRQIADASNLVFVTDNAQAAGAKSEGVTVGGIADIECHSFYPTKNLGALGGAGAVTTSNTIFAERLRALRNYGSTQRYVHDSVGFNNRIDELQAGILRVKLRHLDDWNERRKSVVKQYLERLNADRRLTLPQQPTGYEHVWHQFVIRTDERDSVLDRLKQCGVHALIHYPVPPHRSGAYQHQFATSDFPIADQLAQSCLSLPISPTITDKDVNQVADTLLSCLPNEWPRRQNVAA